MGGWSSTSLRGVSLNGAVGFVAKTSAEIAFELATDIPVITSPKNLAKSLININHYLKSSFWLNKFKGGVQFEKTMINMFGLTKNKKCFNPVNLAVKHERGCFIPDVYEKGARLIEIKTSFGAMKKDQFQTFIKLAQRNMGTRFSLIFFRKPSEAQIKIMQRWAIEASEKNGDDMLFNIIHILD